MGRARRMRGLLTRRSFLARSGAVFGALSLPALARARTQETAGIYKLARNGPTCVACGRQDTKKLFPTRKAANGNRAHIGCNCRIVEGTIDRRGYDLLFGPGAGNRKPVYSVDRRTRSVHAILE